GVGRPDTRVECAARRGHGCLRIGDGGVRRIPEHLTGRRVEGRKRPLGLEELPPDQEVPFRALRCLAGTAALTRDRCCFLHLPPRRTVATGVMWAYVMETAFSSPANHTFAG